MIIQFLFVFVCSISVLLGSSFCHKITSYEDFEKHSKLVDNERFTKFVLDLQNDTIYYFDVNTYPMHVDFIFKELYKKPVSFPLYDEYVKNYSETKPQFLFCYLIHHIKHNLWTLALWEGDKATKLHIQKGFAALSKSFYLVQNVLFRPTSNAQEVMAKTLENIAIVTNDDLFLQSDYQLLNAGISVGILRIAKDNIKQDYNEDEIILLPELIPDTSWVAGIITEQFSTPLSHLALRARSWNIPHAGIKEAASLYAALDGHYVYFETLSSGYILRLASEKEIKLYNNNLKKPGDIVLPVANVSESRLKTIHELERQDYLAYGTKAANLGECTKLAVPIPQGFAIPFYYYEAHVKKSGPQHILSHPLDQELLDEAWEKAQNLFKTGFFVRSSTNAEDLAWFNGAGLYETVANVKDKKSLEMAIKTVWASIYNPKAIKERERYGINSGSVYAAILIQESVDATAAGVLVTKDIFDPTEDMEVYTINASHGLGLSVVEGAMIPEQLLYNFDNKGIKVLSRASRGPICVCDETGGLKLISSPEGPVLTDDQVTTLGNTVHRIKRLFRAAYPLDIEWLFKDDSLYIVQVRPF